MFSNPKIPVSLEFFPPKTAQGADKLRLVRQELYGLNPSYCSVTFGAGGSTQEGTFQTVSEILSAGHSAASHFTCINATRDTVRAQLATLQAMGVKRLVALRGDLPEGYHQGDFFTHQTSCNLSATRPATLSTFRWPATLKHIRKRIPPKQISTRLPRRPALVRMWQLRSIFTTATPTFVCSKTWTLRG